VIELVGISHLYIAMKAIGINASLIAAVMGYIVSVIFLIVSPFLRGLVPIEVSMTYLLTRFGISNVDAVAVTLMYRLFEFWTPLFAGILSFLSGLGKLLMRTLPALFMLLLGIVNVISAITLRLPGDYIYYTISFLPVLFMFLISRSL